MRNTDLDRIPIFRKSTRRAFLGAGLGVLALLHGAPFAFGSNPNLSKDDIADLNRVSAYLNSMRTLKAEFSQIDSGGGYAEGVLYMQRPDRVRFEYQSPPNMPLIISDGQFVVMDDRALKTQSRYPLSATPLAILLRDKVDLAGETRIVAVDRAPGMLSITARDDKGLTQGELTMVFSDPALELRNWVIKDAQGYYTTIAVRNLRPGVKLDKTLFQPRKVGGPAGKRF